MDRKVVLIAYVVLISLISTYSYAKFLEVSDYIGDEVWYVSASRNVLHKLGFSPKYEEGGYYGVNVILPENVDRNNLSLKVRIWSSFSSCQNQNPSHARPPARTQVEYRNINGFYYEVREDCLESVLNLDYGITTITGYKYPDKKNIVSYLNTEHPFFGKGLIGLSMLVEDSPFFWRLPGFLERILLIFLVSYVAYVLTEDHLTSAIAATIAAFDKLLLSMSVTAMLDIHVAFFAVLALVMFLENRYRLTGIFLGLGVATKMNLAFLPLVFAPILLKRRNYRELLIMIVLALAAFIAAHVPLMVAIGPAETIKQLISSFGWHLSTKENHPAISPVWTWFYSAKAFPLHYGPNLSAEISEHLFQGALVSSAFFPVLEERRSGGNLGIVYASFWAGVLFYVIHYLLGGKNQYSFYATPLVPLAAIMTAALIRDAVNWELLGELRHIFEARLKKERGEAHRAKSRR
ncbi:glycosyltransferase, putative [Thermococcus sp. 2319x1]|uniref:glycosyltransferase 87 family protein n=1 Tax=Thermococcus sp. 2319x1 TaxID=1674923 RepID=UPI00073AB618|nr:glycosyltransferase 87 family protein [Thermococcus sp. 2319x1]ALV63958.1 glycosyltransferase, putative [Thermococcus sp. 2319x1]